MRGLTLVWRKMTINILHGYLPSSWTEAERRDVDRAINWLGNFIDWYDDRKETEDGTGEVAAVADGTDAKEQGQVEGETRGPEGEEPGENDPISVGVVPDIFGHGAGDPNGPS